MSLVAVGQGPTIVASPEISSVMDLGPLFSSRPVYYRFVCKLNRVRTGLVLDLVS